MKYKGIYWSLFAPMIKKSIQKRYSKELAEKAIQNGKAEYRGLLSRSDELGPGNPMAMNAYFAYVFAAAWLGSDKEITPDGMGEVMFRLQHGVLHREHTLARNEGECDYWIVGDKNINLK